MDTINSIHFTIGEEFTPKIERFEDFQTSYFKDIYKKVFPVVEQITLGKQQKEVNNIIAFIGDRGSGKTSCMRSVANVLIDQGQCDKLVDQGYLDSKLKGHVYLTIDLIDPSFFEESANILEIAIAKMFTNFRNYVKKNEQDCYDAERVECKRQLIEAFQQVKEDIDQLYSDNQGESLETLINKAAALNLRDSLGNLVGKYLTYFHHPEGTLILMVDDLDLHTTHAYRMVEQIRKYLMLPNVLICMAIKLEQLKYILKKHFAKEFEILNRKGTMDELLEAMSERYLEKLIPHERRFYLPDLEVNFYRSLVIHKDANDKEGTLYNSIREAVLTLIFKKTRFLFYNTKGKTSYIVPRNLRELRTIISLLFNMSDYWDGEVRPEYNKVLFQKYFFETWVPNNLSKENQDIVQALRDSEVVSRNKVLVNFLFSRLKIDEKNSYSNKFQGGVADIVNNQNKPYNISIGDVQLFWDEMETECITNRDDLKLIFVIKTLYSIWLYQYYDELTAIPENDKTTLPEVFKKEFMLDVSNFTKLIGGSFMNADRYNLIPPDIKSNSRAIRIIDGSLLNVILSEINKAPAKETEISVTLNEEEGEKKYKVNINSALKLIEFFALTISRMWDVKKRPYRMLSEVYYDFDASPNNKNYLFDVMSCMYNLLDISRAYQRFNFLEELAKKTKGSLYHQFQTKYKKRLVSKVSIRNIEVLDQFFLHMQKYRPQGSSNDIDVLANFFNSAGGFEIYTYDAETDKDHYKIAFDFLKSILGNLLDEINKKDANSEVLKKIFNAIFSGNSISSTNTVKPEIDIQIGIYKTKKNSKATLLKKLDVKNPGLVQDLRYIELKKSLFVKPFYTYNGATAILETMQKEFNG